MGVPYVGSNCGSSWLCMDKILTKTLCEKAGIATAKFTWVESLEDTETIELLKDMANPRKFNFDEEFKKGLTSEEFSKRTTDFLKGLKWEK